VGNEATTNSAGTQVAVNSASDNDLANCINKGYRFALAFGAVAAVFFVVIAGYMYMVGGEKGKHEAKEILTSIIVGFLIMLSSYVLLRQINPTLVQFRTIQPPRITGTYNLPSCEQLGIGVGTACMTAAGTPATSNGNGGVNQTAGDGQARGKKFILVGDSLSVNLHRPLAALIQTAGGTMLTNKYEVVSSNVKNWAEGGGSFTKVSDIIRNEQPDVVMILLNTNQVSNYQQYIRAIAGQTSGKTAYWIGAPNHYGCTAGGPKIDDSYIQASNRSAATAYGANFYDTYDKLPHLQIGGKTTDCDIHALDYSRWAAGFWGAYYH
jgi:hypothetical protein